MIIDWGVLLAPQFKLQKSQTLNLEIIILKFTITVHSELIMWQVIRMGYMGSNNFSSKNPTGFTCLTTTFSLSHKVV